MRAAFFLRTFKLWRLDNRELFVISTPPLSQKWRLGSHFALASALKRGSVGVAGRFLRDLRFLFACEITRSLACSHAERARSRLKTTTTQAASAATSELRKWTLKAQRPRRPQQRRSSRDDADQLASGDGGGGARRMSASTSRARARRLLAPVLKAQYSQLMIVRADAI